VAARRGSFSPPVRKAIARRRSPLIEGLSADALREVIAEKDAEAVIPNNSLRSTKYILDIELYKECQLIECCFSKLKQFTRFEKTARNFRAIIAIAATILRLR
jgi:transposase